MDRLMALVLLRWQIEVRGLLRARERLFGLLLLVPFLLLGSALAFAFVYIGVRGVERTRPELTLPVLSAAATGVGLFWALSPLLAGIALSETHEVSRILHFPVPLSTLAVSSLIANLIQPTTLAKLSLLLAVSLGASRRAALFPLSLAGAALSFVFILSASQVLGLVLHGLARNRRLHDLALFLGLGLGFAVSLIPVMVLTFGGRPIGFLTRHVVATDLFALSPFAWGVRAAVHGGRGELLPFAAYAAASLVAIGGAVSVSALLIQRIFRGELDLGGAAAGRALPARMLFRGALGALLEKDLRAAWRDPALKATLLMGFVGPLLALWLLWNVGGPSGSGNMVLFLATFVGLSGFGGSAFGFERRGIQLLMGFPVARWRILVAKNLAVLAFRAPGLVTLALSALFLAPAEFLPAALVIAVVTLITAAGVDNYMSILFPVTFPAPGSNPYGGGTAGGRGLGAAAFGALMLGFAVIASSPFAALAWLPALLERRWLWTVSLPLALAGAASVYAMLVAGAARMLQRREPELMERILGESSD